MPKLSNMVGETGQIEIVSRGEEPLVVTYRRGVMTPRLQKDLIKFEALRQSADAAALGAAPEAIDFLCSMAARLIQSWNLTDDDGAPIGTDPEALLDVDLGLLTTVLQEIGRAMSPDPLNGSDSSNGSSQTGSSEPRLITTAS